VGYAIEFLPLATRQFTALSKNVQVSIGQRIDALQREPRPHGTVLLKGELRLWRLRSGDYRIIYQIDDAARVVVIVKIGHRREIYRDR
jgi:mRNA interferase RelE/StbE